MLLSYKKKNYSLSELINEVYFHIEGQCPTSRFDNELNISIGVEPDKVMMANLKFNRKDLSKKLINDSMTKMVMDQLINKYPHYNDERIPVDFINVHLKNDYN